jgi:phosphoribosylglycinamide formyltransferase 1
MTPPSSVTPARLVVLISGNGSNLQAVLDACVAGDLPARVGAVFSDRPDAVGLERARRAQVPAIAVPMVKGRDRRAYDAALAAQVSAFQPDWVVLAGWMRVLSSAFLDRFPGRVVNLHPALPGTFPGTHALERAYAAWQSGAIAFTGVMVHLVPDEGVDCGPVLAQRQVSIEPGDSLEALTERVHAAEHILLVDALKGLVQR